MAGITAAVKATTDELAQQAREDAEVIRILQEVLAEAQEEQVRAEREQEDDQQVEEEHPAAVEHEEQEGDQQKEDARFLVWRCDRHRLSPFKRWAGTFSSSFAFHEGMLVWREWLGVVLLLLLLVLFVQPPTPALHMPVLTQGLSRQCGKLFTPSGPSGSQRRVQRCHPRQLGLQTKSLMLNSACFWHQHLSSGTQQRTVSSR